MKKSTKIILSAVSIALLSGCQMQQKLQEPQKPVINQQLPQIDSDSIKMIPDVNSVALEWTRSHDRAVNGYHIYRAEAKESTQLQRIATLDTRYASHYLDTADIKPNTTYVYAISAKGSENFESLSSKNIAVTTLPPMEPISLFNAISNLPRQIKLIWRPHPDKKVAEYQIEKRLPESTEWKKLATVKGRLQVEFIDTNLEDDRIYFYRIKAISFDKVSSEYSLDAKAQTKPLPQGVSNVTVSNNLPKAIELKWQPSATNDVEYYNIYKNSTDWGMYSAVAQVPANTTAFQDKIGEDGVNKFYKITAVDVDGLESKISKTPVMGVTLPKPEKPIITLAQIADDKVILNWKAGDKRTKSFVVYKSVRESWLKSNKIEFAKMNNDLGAMFQRIEDKDIVRGVEYKYTVEAVDEFGIVSEESPAAALVLPVLPTKKEDIEVKQVEVK